MLKTLTQIQEDVQKVGSRVFDANSWEFRRGFNMCYEFFSIALSKSTLYHQSILFERIKELEQQLEEKQKGTENLAKVSSAGMIALESTYVSTILLKDRCLHVRNKEFVVIFLNRLLTEDSETAVDSYLEKTDNVRKQGLRL